MAVRLRQLRAWWAKERLSRETPSSVALFGWFLSFTPTVLDIVVAVTVDEHSLFHSVLHLEEILHQTNEKMPAGLRDKSVLCMLGHAAEFCTDGASTVSKKGNTTQSNSLGHASFLMESDLITNDNGCCKIAEPIKPHREAAMKKVTLAINSSAFTSARLCSKRQMKPNVFHSSGCAFTVRALVVSLATLSTLQYIVLQYLHNIVSSALSPRIQMMTLRLFESTSTIIKIRSHEIFYWPIFLERFDFRSHSCVEYYAEQAARKRHFLWSNVAADVILGNLVGFTLLLYAESILLWCVNLCDDINDFLWIGCVYLMGVPVGFKLNTELAAVLGSFSLNVIPAWFILWGFIRYCLLHIIIGIAVVGMLFGVTALAAIIMDIFVAVTFHISALHWLAAHLYSIQIEALAGFWQLFRGQKWNPLRLRLDSYDYTVKQHVVGSLLFSPLLLLLPTTSVFYIFFTITSNYASLVRILIRVLISITHATPFFDIFMYLLRPARFPAGLWFEVSLKDTAVNNQEDCHLNGHVQHQGVQDKLNKCRDESL